MALITREDDLVEMLKKGLSETLKDRALKSFVDEQVDEFRVKITEQAQDALAGIVIGDIQQVRDMMAARDEMRVRIEVGDLSVEKTLTPKAHT